MNVLLINVHSFRNAGDQALAEVSIQQIRRCFPGCRVTVAMNDPESSVRTTEVEKDAVVDTFFTWFKKDLAPGKRLSLVALGLGVWSMAASVLIAVGHRVTGARLLFLLPQRHRPAVAAYLSADASVSCAGTLLAQPRPQARPAHTRSRLGHDVRLAMRQAALHAAGVDWPSAPCLGAKPVALAAVEVPRRYCCAIPTRATCSTR